MSTMEYMVKTESLLSEFSSTDIYSCTYCVSASVAGYQLRKGLFLHLRLQLFSSYWYLNRQCFFKNTSAFDHTSQINMVFLALAIWALLRNKANAVNKQNSIKKAM